MEPLKAGHVHPEEDFNLSMAYEMDEAMKTEWHRVKGEDLSPMPSEDRRILFVAVARGVLRYLQKHGHDIGTTRSNGGDHSHTLEFTVSDP